MLYPYAEFPGRLIVTCSEIINDEKVEGKKKILVNFEMPTDFGFKEARYSLPDYKMIFNEDFSPSETKRNEKILHNNAELIWEVSEEESKKRA
ncbi:hypothetical protein [Lactobacillus ultunensis]|uniref:Uncharacterized protein n=1 Tax=Lactobacillus ultunensis DSM 16047 TaxID=525365 RepID=C2EL27_9LACO|nr:hypothetical protein [Lactobacillus ultunensis]EEJ72773.1 hypothetical protein HMPREF0548_0373 [Lactobacillus ultunensis DSM 16047]KRL83027.1 hypothetical protein FC57_GL000018 [Lactobacillus ultunensis DSM 16047]QQP29096.1 hypothetical protein H4B44_03310 [Lactobacillus ultunensis]